MPSNAFSCYPVEDQTPLCKTRLLFARRDSPLQDQTSLCVTRPGLYVNTVHQTATRNVLNTLRNVQPVHPNNRTRLVRSPFNRTREKTSSGVDLSPRLRNSRRIHMARFSGPGDHSGPISTHFRRFGHFGPDPSMRLQHWRSTLAFNIDIQH